MIHSLPLALVSSQDVGSDGLSSHWEARVLQGSIMAALLVEPSLIRIDHITLAALQDTGWYSVNFSQAQSLVWGEGKTSTIEPAKQSSLLVYIHKDTYHALVEAGVKPQTCLFTVLPILLCGSVCVLGKGSQFGSLSTCHNSSTFFCTDR